MTITLWTPSADSSARWVCVDSWWNLETPNNEKLRLYRSGANNIKYSWNKAVLDFLATDDEWLLSWHSDVTGAPQTLMRLLSWGRPIVSALVFMRTGPAMPHIWKGYEGNEDFYSPRIKDTRKWFYDHPDCIKNFGAYVMEDRPADALTPVDFTSTSCMLIHRTVLESMRTNVKDIWFQWDDDHKGGGEDRRFCQEAKRAGYETFVDRSCVVGHLGGDNAISAADFFAWDYVSTINGTGESPIKI